MLKRFIFLILFFLILAGCEGEEVREINSEFARVSVGDAVVRAEVVRDLESQVKGLSGRDSLGDDEGMLFVYDEARVRSFWMKGMRFPIDIIFINDNIVVDVARDLPLPKFGEELVSYTSREEANYVLEVGAGMVEDYNIERGDGVDILW